METATLEEMFGLEPEHRFIELPRIGWVEIRELDGHELVLCHTAALIEDPVTGSVTFDPALHIAIKVAASMVSPSLGDTIDERIANADRIKEMPARVNQILVAEVERLSSVTEESLNQMSTIIDSVPFLYDILEVLAEHNGWLKDLEGKTVSEFRTWVAFHRSQRARMERALAELR